MRKGILLHSCSYEFHHEKRYRTTQLQLSQYFEHKFFVFITVYPSMKIYVVGLAETVLWSTYNIYFLSEISRTIQKYA